MSECVLLVLLLTDPADYHTVVVLVMVLVLIEVAYGVGGSDSLAICALMLLCCSARVDCSSSWQAMLLMLVVAAF
jgi:hypothetical protein